MQVTTIGLDLAKNVFQLHGIDEGGHVVLRRRLRRDRLLEFFADLPACLIGIEACATAHYWARELQALGHDVRLMPPTYVKPYVKRQKNDAADAEAICEAVTRPTMRFVPVKSTDSQSVLLLHRTRHLLVRQRTAQINALRSHLAEFGVIGPQGRQRVKELIDIVQDESDPRLTPLTRRTLGLIVRQLDMLTEQIIAIEKELLAWHRQHEISRRLETIPGIGVITATALAASAPDPTLFRSARHFAAWLGLIPKQNSSGGKHRLGHISKMGNRYLRHLLVIGATANLRSARSRSTALHRWAAKLMEHKPGRLVRVAMANKLARIAWALMYRGGSFQATVKAA